MFGIVAPCHDCGRTFSMHRNLDRSCQLVTNNSRKINNTSLNNYLILVIVQAADWVRSFLHETSFLTIFVSLLLNEHVSLCVCLFVLYSVTPMPALLNAVWRNEDMAIVFADEDDVDESKASVVASKRSGGSGDDDDGDGDASESAAPDPDDVDERVQRAVVTPTSAVVPHSVAAGSGRGGAVDDEDDEDDEDDVDEASIKQSQEVSLIFLNKNFKTLMFFFKKNTCMLLLCCAASSIASIAYHARGSIDVNVTVVDQGQGAASKVDKRCWRC